MTDLRPQTFHPQPYRSRAQQRWRRCRQMVCLLAEDAASGEAVGCCIVKCVGFWTAGRV